MKIITFGLLALLLAGCAGMKHDPEIASTRQSDNTTACAEPRPEICTREYRPVCAQRDTGIRCITTPCPSSEPHTYANACEACSDPKVFGYRDGACPSEDMRR